MQEQFDSLERKLNETIQFPDTYTFKFIYALKEKTTLKQRVEDLLSKHSMEIVTYNEKISSKGTYVSSSYTIQALNAKQLVSVYKDSQHIEGITVL